MNNQDLHTLLEKANRAYHLGNPIMSDAEFDLLSEYAGVEFFGTDDGTVPHMIKLPRLAKFKSASEVLNALKSKKNVVVSQKLDGICIVVVYENGIPKMAKTRGNGKAGHVIHNAILSILKPLKQPLNTEIAGELIDLTAKDVKASRSTVAGLAHRLHLEFEDVARLSFLAHTGFTLPELVDLGLDTPQFEIIPELTLEAIEEAGKKYMLEYCDGLVFNSEVAWKPAHMHVAKVVSVTWSAGKANYVPTVHYEPITIEGITCRKASLHSANKFEAFNLGPGDLVTIALSGKTIPQIVNVLHRSDSERFTLPTHYNGIPLKRVGAHLKYRY
jgi:DNA ligase (NAD+)